MSGEAEVVDLERVRVAFNALDAALGQGVRPIPEGELEEVLSVATETEVRLLKERLRVAQGQVIGIAGAISSIWVRGEEPKANTRADLEKALAELERAYVDLTKALDGDAG